MEQRLCDSVLFIFIPDPRASLGLATSGLAGMECRVMDRGLDGET